MMARVPRPPRTPQMGDRQPRVFPTARTMVKASTHSTMLATKAGTAAMASVARAALIGGTTPRSRSHQLVQHYCCTSYVAGAEPSARARVGHVAQAVAQQVDRQHRRGDAHAWRDHLP